MSRIYSNGSFKWIFRNQIGTEAGDPDKYQDTGGDILGIQMDEKYTHFNNYWREVVFKRINAPNHSTIGINKYCANSN